MNKYQKYKEKARQEAIEWQRDFEAQDYCPSTPVNRRT